MSRTSRTRRCICGLGASTGVQVERRAALLAIRSAPWWINFSGLPLTSAADIGVNGNLPTLQQPQKTSPMPGFRCWNDFRPLIKPVLDEQKKQGLISDYKAFINPTTNQPSDWDVAVAILYPSWASLDQIDAKAATIVVKHYGSREAAFEAARKG